MPDNRRMNPGRSTAAPHPLLILLVACIITGTSGCIQLAGTAIGGTPAPAGSAAGGTGSVAAGEAAVETPATLQGQGTNATVTVTSQETATVRDASPVLTVDPYPVQHGTQINDSAERSFLSRIPVASRTYTLRGNASALVVDVPVGPLWIVYNVTPEYDCLAHPDDCRGTLTVPVNRPYMTITVRDNRTGGIVAQDGYGREYSSDTGEYKVDILADDKTVTSYPGPRVLTVYRTGEFHITIEGDYLDTHVAIITGSSPFPAATPAASGTSAQQQARYPWERR